MCGTGTVVWVLHVTRYSEIPIRAVRVPDACSPSDPVQRARPNRTPPRRSRPLRVSSKVTLPRLTSRHNCHQHYHYPPPFRILVHSSVLPHAHIPRASSHANFFSTILLLPETDRFPAAPVGLFSSAHVGLKHRPLSVQITREIYNLLL